MLFAAFRVRRVTFCVFFYLRLRHRAKLRYLLAYFIINVHKLFSFSVVFLLGLILLSVKSSDWRESQAALDLVIITALSFSMSSTARLARELELLL